MSELHLEPCPHCGCRHVKVVNWSGTSLTAAQCRACGARGPVRPIMAENDIAAVHALAADDWNVRFPLGEMQAIFDRLDAKEATEKEQPQRVPSVESPATADELVATTDPEPDNGGAVVASSNTTQGEAINQGTADLPAPSPTQEALTPGDGGGKGTQPNISPTPDPSAAPAASQPVDPKGDDRKSSNGGEDVADSAVRSVVRDRLRSFLLDEFGIDASCATTDELDDPLAVCAEVLRVCSEDLRLVLTDEPLFHRIAERVADGLNRYRKAMKAANKEKTTTFDAVLIGSRLRRYLKDVNEKTPQGAIKRGHDLGVSWCTAQKIMDGKRVSDHSLETCSNALDVLEKPNKETADLSEFQDSVTERLQAFMDRRQLNADLGSKMYAQLLLTSESVLYDILTMKAWPSNATLRDIDMALEKLERREETETPEGEQTADKGFQRLGGYDESKVQVLPNELPPIKRLNPLPVHTPPARCAKT